jgi:Zn-dependent M28 family amino/carboxypeptidase
MLLRATYLFALLAGLGCSNQTTTARALQGDSLPVDSARVVDDLRYLSSPERQGRAVGTPGNEAARVYIHNQLKAAGVQPFPAGWLQRFEFGGMRAVGYNVVGFVPGTRRTDRYIVVTAHYDHLGVRNGDLYPGADDNASGTAALLEIARYFAANRPENSIIFAALDAEEIGLQGAQAFVAEPPVPISAIVLNVNMDMVSRSERNELYAAGTFHYPFLLDLVRTAASSSQLKLLAGHDQPMSGHNDWTQQSDHGAFHDLGIPFVYFGVEDHPDYHRPTDTFENTDPRFFVRAVSTVLDFVQEADARLDVIEQGRRGAKRAA